jgi:PadR family transcriptional regulator
VALTITTVRVLNAFIEQPTDKHYGLELMRRTGLKSGTLYPVLARLERMGWLRSSAEDIDPVDAGRPARRYYEITPDGLEGARLAKAEMFAQLAPAQPQRRLEGGIAWT